VDLPAFECVADLSVGIATRLGFSSDEIRQLRRAALLHDIGKLGVSSLILDKPGKLTDAEFDVVRKILPIPSRFWVA
jgi:HD-GYP domain-containing protein (c-di-GMP phosphodiesterase class II)